MDRVEFRVHAVDAADALDQSRRIPRDIVVKDDVRPMQVYTLGEHLGGDENAEFIARSKCLRIEIRKDLPSDRLIRAAGEQENIFLDLLCDSSRQDIPQSPSIR